MNCHEREGIRWYSFENLDRLGVPHGLVTRRGGVSPSPHASLNLGSTNGDKPANVEENRRRMYAAIGREPGSRFNSWQVHGTTMLFTDAPRDPQIPPQPGDGIFTQNPEVTLTMVFADCIPILIHDPVQKVAGLVHAGWGGTLHQVASVAVSRMAEQYGSHARDLVVGLGPSICGKCYEVGQEVYESFLRLWGDAGQAFFKPQGQRYLLDLWAANEYCLRQAGVEQIEQSGLCTAENLDDWYSYRKERGATGRFAAVIALKGDDA